MALHDDITVYGKDDADHGKNLIALIERTQQKGLTLNSKKCSIRREAVSFFGATFSKDGISPDTRNI